MLRQYELRSLLTIVAQAGNGAIIVDAGGGTIDINAYGMTPSTTGNSFEEIAPSQCKSPNLHPESREYLLMTVV
jgi:hypothetical protein